MLTSGLLYIAHNPSALPGFLKIGVTRKSLEIRMTELSRSTSVFGKFQEVFSCEVPDLFKAESLVHLLLQEYRCDPRKEFFQINSKKAIVVLKRVKAILNNTPNFNVFLQNDFFDRQFNKRLSGRQHSLFLLTLCHSHNNSILDRLMGFPPDLVDGFLDVASVQKHHHTTPSHIRSLAKQYSRLAQDLTISIGQEKPFRVYQDIRYAKGQLCWTFTTEMKHKFMS